MPMLNRDADQAKFTNLYLGKDTREMYQDTIDKIKKTMGIKNFVIRSLVLYINHPSLFGDEQ